jgi:hypothetical protein
MDAKESWAELSDRLEALGLKLKMHLAQADTGEGVPQALTELRERVDEAFRAAGQAINDEAVRADVREVGRLFADAVSTSLAKVSDDVRDAWERRR